jgi:hypothetical protein
MSDRAGYQRGGRGGGGRGEHRGGRGGRGLFSLGYAIPMSLVIMLVCWRDFADLWDKQAGMKEEVAIVVEERNLRRRIFLIWGNIWTSRLQSSLLVAEKVCRYHSSTPNTSSANRFPPMPSLTYPVRSTFLSASLVPSTTQLTISQ